MPRSDQAAAIARAVGIGLVLVLPVAALVVLRQFPPLVMDPDGATGWLAAVFLGAVGLLSAVAVVPLLASLVSAGRLAAGAAGFSGTAFTAGTAALALAGPTAAATLPNSGLGLTLVVGASGLAVGAWAGSRTVPDERTRWLAVIVALVLAELALAAALLAPGSPLDEATPAIMAGAALIAGGAAAVWAFRRLTMAAFASATVALAALLLAAARPGTADPLVGLSVLAVAPALMVGAFVGDVAASVVGDVVPQRPLTGVRTVEPAPSALKPPPGPVGAADTAERDRLGRELRAALAELTDARHTIALQRAELERAADIDALTGVGSRAAIMDRLRDEVAEARRYPHPVSIVLIDVDGMGDINAANGTAAGDAVLRELALRIRVRVREADAIGRVAGDAFLVILPHTDEHGATVFAESIRDRATQRPISTGKGEVAVTVSIGLTTMRADLEMTADTLLGRADEAVASARAGGGNVIAFDRLHGLARLDERRQTEPRDEDDALDDQDEA